MTRVYCCFPFFREFDVLDAHLRELEGVVDTFVLVEATRTHTGHPKPLYFQEIKTCYRQYKIAHHVVELAGPPSGDNPGLNWGREAAQRNAIMGVLVQLGAQDADIVLSLDVDEIPTAAVVEEYKNSRTDISCIEMPTYHYNLNTRLETPTQDPKICRFGSLKSIGPSLMRYMQTAWPLHVLKGGWHLSFMGGVDKIIEKVKAYAHYDDREPRMQQFVSRENVEASIREKKSIYMRPDIKYFDEPDPVLPQYIAENRQRFIDIGWIRG